MSQQGVLQTDGQTNPEIRPQVYLGPIENLFYLLIYLLQLRGMCLPRNPSNLLLLGKLYFVLKFNTAKLTVSMSDTLSQDIHVYSPSGSVYFQSRLAFLYAHIDSYG